MDLTVTQKRLLDEYQTKISEERRDKIDQIVKEKFAEEHTQKKSLTMQKIRLIDASAPTITKTAILSIWNADDKYSSLQENILIEAKFTTAKGMHGKDIQISTGKYSSIREIKQKPTSIHDQYKRRVTSLSDINLQLFKPQFNELDTVGYCFEIEDYTQGQFQSAFITDAHSNILCIKFWDGIKQYAYDNIVSVGNFLIFHNLDWRQPHNLNPNGFPQAFATEFTLCSVCPKLNEQKNALSQLQNEFKEIDMDQYRDECSERITRKNSPLKSLNNTIKSNKSMSQSRIENESVNSNQSTSITRQKSDTTILYGKEPPPLQGYYINGGTPLRRSLKLKKARPIGNEAMKHKENQQNR